MQKSQFTDEQIVAILQQAEKGEKTISEICGQHNIAENTFYRWRTCFGGMNTNEAARVCELEKESARLKRLVAERDLEVDIIKEILQTPMKSRPQLAAGIREIARGSRRLEVAAETATEIKTKSVAEQVPGYCTREGIKT